MQQSNIKSNAFDDTLLFFDELCHDLGNEREEKEKILLGIAPPMNGNGEGDPVSCLHA